jgi:hypothetical protein
VKKRTCLAISCFFLAGLGVYIYCTPFISLYQLHQAIAQHNRKEIEAGVDFDSLRNNIKPQVRTKVSDGLEKSLGGKNFISSSIANLGMAFASPVVDHKVDEAISPEGLQKLLADIQKPNGNKDDFDAIEQLKTIKFGYKNLDQFNLQLLDPSSKRPIGITMNRHQLLHWKVAAIKLP